MVHWLASLCVFTLVAMSSLGAGLRADQLSTNNSYESLFSPVYSGPSNVQSQTPSPNLEIVGQIGGSVTTIAVEGEWMYAGIGLRFAVLSLADPAYPSLVGQTDTIPGMVQHIAPAGRYVYAAVGYDGLRIIDVIDPATPVEAGFVTGPGDWIGDLALVGQTLYAITSAGLSVFDLTDPVAPVKIGDCAIAGPDGGASVTVVDDIAYVAANRGGLQMFDVADPTALVEIGQYQGYERIPDVSVIGNYAYVVTGSNLKMVVLDVTDPAVPVEVGSYRTLGNTWHVAAIGGYVYVVGGNGVSVINVSNPAMPVQLGVFEMAYAALDLAVADELVYVVTPEGIVEVIRGPDPASILGVGYHSTPDPVKGMAVDGNYAYAATGRQLKIFDVTDPISPVEVATHDTPGTAMAVTLAGSLAYVGNANYGVRIIDVSDPNEPFELGYFDTPSVTRDVAVSGSYAYLAEGEGLRILDVTDPTMPLQIAYHAGTDSAIGVAVVGDYAYIVYGAYGYLGGLEVVNVSNPAGPFRSGDYSLVRVPRDVAVADGYAYVASDDGLHVIDVTNPVSMTQVSYVAADYAKGVAVTDDYAYLAGQNILKAVDISDPAALVLVASYVPQLGDGYDIALDEGYAYVAATNGLHVLDMRTLVAPLVSVGRYVPPGVSADRVALADQYAYTVDDSGGFTVIDVTNPVAPVGVGSLAEDWQLKDLDAADGYVYLASSFPKLRILDVTQPATPAEVGQAFPDLYSYDVAVAGTYLYLVDSYGLHVMDVTDRQNPLEVGSVQLFWASETLEGRSIVVDGGYAYVAEAASHWRTGLAGGLRIIDISDPAAPVEVKFYNLHTAAWGVAVEGNYAYIVYRYGLRIIDVSIPDTPTFLADFTETVDKSIAVEGPFAYITSGGGVMTIDISDPSAPVESDYYTMPCWAADVAVADGSVYVADTGCGLYVLRHAEPLDPWHIWLPEILRF